MGNKKNGEGVYHFINADVYEGEFRDDRMDGHGVYTFRWVAAVRAQQLQNSSSSTTTTTTTNCAPEHISSICGPAWE